jgi:HEAT repeat protein
MMIVSFGDALVKLESEAEATIIDGLNMIASVGLTGSPARPQVMRLIEHNLESVRYCAVKALVEITPRGCESIVLDVIDLIYRTVGGTRRAALSALSQVAEKGNCTAMTALSSCFDDESECGVALDSFMSLADKGDEHAIGLLLSALDKTDNRLWHDISRSVVELAERGDQRVIAELSKGLMHKEGACRWSTIRALGQLAQVGDSGVISAVLCHLDDADLSTREAAVSTLTLLVEKGENCLTMAVVEACCDRLAHVRGPVRRTALDALRQIGMRGNACIVAAILPCLQDADWHVKEAALHALMQLAEKGDVDVLMAITPCLAKTEHHKVQRIGRDALQQLRTPEAMKRISQVCVEKSSERSAEKSSDGSAGTCVTM